MKPFKKSQRLYGHFTHDLDLQRLLGRSVETSSKILQAMSTPSCAGERVCECAGERMCYDFNLGRKDAVLPLLPVLHQSQLVRVSELSDSCISAVPVTVPPAF